MKRIWNFIIHNVYIKNILIAAILFVALILGVFKWLDIYTRHGQAIVVPDVRGLSISEAATQFKERALLFSIVDSVYNNNVPPGGIVETMPKAGIKVKEGRTIFLTVNSMAPALLVIPDLQYQSVRQARATLLAVGFSNISVKYVPGPYKDLVAGITHNETDIFEGDRIAAQTPLTLLVNDGMIDPPGYQDSTEIDSDTFEEVNTPEDSWF